MVGFLPQRRTCLSQIPAARHRTATRAHPAQLAVSVPQPPGWKKPLSHARRLAVLLACTALVAPGLALAQALPQGGQFVAGQGSIGAAVGSSLTITQTSARGVIDWRSFNIGQGASVTVNNGAGATLNRVTGGDLSQILGSLRATGSIYLVNPQGVVIGASGVVVTGGRFVASSLDVANDAFMAGGTLVFRGTTENAEVRNLGAISSTGGDVILISRAVRNEGSIAAPRGTAALAAGTEVLLREGQDGRRGLVRVSGASGDVTNTGRIEAAQAELRAAGGNIYALAGNTQGAIRATGTEIRDGRVWLSARGTGGNVVTEGRIEARNPDGSGGKVAVRAGNAVSNTGTIAADGSSGGAVRVRAARVVQQGTVSARGTSGQGGTLRLLGEHIALTGAEIDASGATGGGVVRIGGGFQGGEGLPQARSVAGDAATAIRADATQRGHGGDVVLWSENRTDFAGRISARGGAEGGDGGQAEVSSRGVLNYTGSADLRAPLGAWGTLLLDPYNIAISNGTQTTAPGFTPNADDSVINAAELMAALGLANVTVSTGLTGSPGSQAGNITVTAALGWASATTLTLQANSAINLNAAITAPAGGLALDAGGTIGATGAIAVGRFTLSNGQWTQTSATLPALTAHDFQLGTGTRGGGTSFLRATGGAGTSGDPWRLADIYGVQGMASRLTGHYSLANDIAAAVTSGWNAGEGFRPIGTSGGHFTGSLDGAGRVISGLTINRPTSDFVGLFGVSGAGSTIRNIGLLGGSVTGKNTVGGLVGTNSGTITQAYATGPVTGGVAVGGLVGTNAGTITQAYATGAASGSSIVGGLVGINQSAIAQAYATGAVSGGTFVGGLTGSVLGSGSVTRAYATGAVTGSSTVGGLAGRSFAGATITEAYASGAVTGSTSTGGLVGENSGTITGSVWDTQTTGRMAGVGTGSATGATGLTTSQARSQAGYASWNFTTEWFQAGDMRPIGRWQAAQPGTDGVRVIRNLNQLQLMAINLGASYRLGNDIDASATNAAANSAGIWGAGGFVPVGNTATSFFGRLDGTGHVVTGLTINRPTSDFVGLFGVAGATISNIGLVGGSVIGRDFTGGLVGSNSGRIAQAYATGTVTGDDGVGGLAGANTGTITQAYATGAVTGSTVVGGLAGINFGSAVITQAYATGTVTGVGNVGGLAGMNNGSTISESVWDTQTSGRSIGIGSGSTTGATGLTTSQMQDIGTFRTTYAGWDFDTVWAPPNQVGQNNGAATAFYPQLYSLSNVAAVFVPDAGRQYGDANPPFGLPTYRGLRAGDTIGTAATIGTTAIATSNIGTYALTASGTTVASPQGRTYRIVHVPGTLTITPRPVTLAGGRAYDGSTTIAASALSVANLVGSDALTLSGAGSVASANASATPQALSFGSLALSGASASNYTLTGGTGTATITPRAVTLAGSRVYDGSTDIAASALSVANLVGSDALTLSGAGSVASANASATPQALTLTGLTLGGASASNYTLTGGTGTATITPRPITVTADPQSRIYGDTNPALTFQIGGQGLVAGDTLTGALATTATPTSHVGPHAITQGSLANPNYAIAFTGNTITVTPATLTITASDAQRQHGQPNPSFSYRVAGLVAGDGPWVISGIELISPATAQSPSGLYLITPIGGLAANYLLLRLPGVLTVLPPRAEARPVLNISTSNIPPPKAQLPTGTETDPQTAAGNAATVPLQQPARRACGAEIGAGILGCNSGFLGVVN